MSEKEAQKYTLSEERPINVELIDEHPNEIRLELDPVEQAELVEGLRLSRKPNAPLMLQEGPGGRYWRIGGKRRITAYRTLLAETGEDHWKKIPAYIVTGEAIDIDMMRLVDNASHRENTTYETARHLTGMKIRYKLDSGEELARKCREHGKPISASHIDKLMQLFSELAPPVLQLWKAQTPFASIPHLTRLLAVTHETQVKLIDELMSHGRHWDWVEAQIDGVKTRKPRGRKPDTIKTRRSQIRGLIKTIERTRLPAPVKRSALSVLKSFVDGASSFQLDGVTFVVPPVQ